MELQLGGCRRCLGGCQALSGGTRPRLRVWGFGGCEGSWAWAGDPGAQWPFPAPALPGEGEGAFGQVPG